MARLVLNCGGVDLVTYKLGNVTTIGRAPLNQIVIDNPAVSAQHAIIARSDECYRLKDLHSANGTQVNDVSVTDLRCRMATKFNLVPS
jgi:pSer/pThr/pTyr-binding forkhead associated (FHA) protein